MRALLRPQAERDGARARWTPRIYRRKSKIFLLPAAARPLQAGELWPPLTQEPCHSCRRGAPRPRSSAGRPGGGDPVRARHRGDGVWRAVATMTTVGYGDLAAPAPSGRPGSLQEPRELGRVRAARPGAPSTDQRAEHLAAQLRQPRLRPGRPPGRARHRHDRDRAIPERPARPVRTPPRRTTQPSPPRLPADADAAPAAPARQPQRLLARHPRAAPRPRRPRDDASRASRTGRAPLTPAHAAHPAACACGPADTDALPARRPGRRGHPVLRHRRAPRGTLSGPRAPVPARPSRS